MDLALPTVWRAGDAMALAVLLVVAVPVVIIDVRSRRIPDAVVVPALVMVLVARGLWGSGGWTMSAVWAGITAMVLLVPALVRPDGMGLGDVKLAALLGACLGALALAGVLLALVTGAVGGGAYALARGTPLRQATIPLGPFLVGAALAVALPVALVHSPRAAADTDHPTHARPAVRPSHVRVGGIGWHPAVAGARAARGARHRCRPGPRCRDAAPGR